MKAEAILSWMRVGPPRLEVQPLSDLSARDPQDTLNYRQLLQICGSATNAFLNLSRSAGLLARRLLLLAPNQTAKHVVAEVLIDGRWVIADATYRTFLKNREGQLLTRTDLQNPVIFRQAVSLIPNYRPEYSYEHVANVRTAAIPFLGPIARRVLDRALPGWDANTDWSLLLERRSFLCFFLSVSAMIVLLLLRIVIAWLADHRFQVPRFHLRHNLSRATAAFFTTPEIK